MAYPYGERGTRGKESFNKVLRVWLLDDLSLIDWNVRRWAVFCGGSSDLIFKKPLS